MAQLLVVTSKVKEVAKAGGFRVSKEFLEAVSEKVREMVITAAGTCSDSGMNTLMARHLEEPEDDD